MSRLWWRWASRGPGRCGWREPGWRSTVRWVVILCCDWSIDANTELWLVHRLTRAWACGRSATPWGTASLCTTASWSPPRRSSSGSRGKYLHCVLKISVSDCVAGAGCRRWRARGRTWWPCSPAPPTAPPPPPRPSPWRASSSRSTSGSWHVTTIVPQKFPSEGS